MSNGLAPGLSPVSRETRARRGLINKNRCYRDHAVMCVRCSPDPRPPLMPPFLSPNHGHTGPQRTARRYSNQSFRGARPRLACCRFALRGTQPALPPMALTGLRPHSPSAAELRHPQPPSRAGHARSRRMPWVLSVAISWRTGQRKPAVLDWMMASTWLQAQC